MQGYLSADIIFSKMRTIFRKQSTRKIVSVDQGTDNVQGQVYRYPPILAGDVWLRDAFRPITREQSLSFSI